MKSDLSPTNEGRYFEKKNKEKSHSTFLSEALKKKLLKKPNK